MPSVRPIAPAPARATVVENSSAKVLWEFYGSPQWVTADASKYIGTLPGHEDGRYGLDYSEFCKDCQSYHSPEAYCAA